MTDETSGTTFGDVLQQLEGLMSQAQAARAAEEERPSWCICAPDYERLSGKKRDPNCRHETIEELLDGAAESFVAGMQVLGAARNSAVEACMQAIEQRDDAMLVVRAMFRAENAARALGSAMAKDAEDAALDMLHENVHAVANAYTAARDAFESKYPGVMAR